MSPPSRAEHALRSFEGRTALLIGDLVLDTYVYGETARVSREAPVLVVRKQRIEHRLGGAANTAANLAALGLTTRVIGTVGDDDAGHRLLGLLREAGVETDSVTTRDAPTPVKTRILAGGAGTSKQQVLRLDEEPATSLSVPHSQRITEELIRRAQDCEVVVVSDYDLGLLNETSIEAISKLSADGHRVAVDSRRRLHRFVGVTVVKPNIPEAEQLVQRPVEGDEAIEQTGREIVKRLRCEACLLTLGRGGMSLFRSDEDPAFASILGDGEVTDVTGAGDTVLAVFAGSLAAGVDMETGMHLANCAATEVVGRQGAYAVSARDVLAVAERYQVGV